MPFSSRSLALALLGVLLGFAALLHSPSAWAQASACDQVYTVKKGDRIAALARTFYGSADAGVWIIAATNATAVSDPSFSPLTAAKNLKPGQKLCIPKPQTALAGDYTALLPGKNSLALVITLHLVADGSATLTRQNVGQDISVAQGTWQVERGKVLVNLSEADGVPYEGGLPLTFGLTGNRLTAARQDRSFWGARGVVLARVGTGASVQAAFEGVRFAIDAALVRSVQGYAMPAVPAGEGPGLGGAEPEHVAFLFDGEDTPQYFDPYLPQVRVYPTAGLRAIDPTIAEQVDALQRLLSDRPADLPLALPVFPPFNAVQVFYAQERYLDFPGGSGVRFVTYYAQDVAPILRDRIFYTFQGLTSDGQYYVTVFWPLRTKLLPATDEQAFGGKRYDAWAQGFETYLSETVGMLDSLMPAGYTPDLTLIDAIVATLAIQADAKPQ